MPVYPTNTHLYNSLWNKYRPVVVKMMVDSADGPQHYQFIQHEFKDINPKEKGGYSFEMHAHQNRAMNNIKMSIPAQNLLEILLNSGKAVELMYADTYIISMDKQFLLTVTKMEVEEEEESEEAAATEAEDTAAETSESSEESAEIAEEEKEEI